METKPSWLTWFTQAYVTIYWLLALCWLKNQESVIHPQQGRVIQELEMTGVKVACVALPYERRAFSAFWSSWNWGQNAESALRSYARGTLATQARIKSNVRSRLKFSWEYRQEFCSFYRLIMLGNFDSLVLVKRALMTVDIKYWLEEDSHQNATCKFFNPS